MYIYIYIYIYIYPYLCTHTHPLSLPGFPCSYPSWRAAGLSVALGTDAACSNDNMDVQGVYHICMCIYIDRHTYVHIYIHMHISIYVYVYIHMYICAYIYVYTCIYVYIYIYIYMPLANKNIESEI